MFTELIRPLFIVAWLFINKESEDEKQSAHGDFVFQKRFHILNSLFKKINSALPLFPQKPCNRLYGFKVKLVT